MNPKSMRLCYVSAEAEKFATVLDNLGFSRRALDGCGVDGFAGAIFEVGNGWIEVWPASEAMPAGIMAQLVVADADDVATRAKSSGLTPQGPVDAHGERIYFLTAPGGLQLSEVAPSA
jgi:hypothetical protein